jgi:hypothetical protein
VCRLLALGTPAICSLDDVVCAVTTDVGAYENINQRGDKNMSSFNGRQTATSSDTESQCASFQGPRTKAVARQVSRRHSSQQPSETERPAPGGIRERIWVRALATANRFRVIRTLDVAAVAFPERPFKASLTAAQRTVRALVKAGLLRRYKTRRFQTVYALSAAGAQWLHERGQEGASSTRRVSDMTNPEHRLWAQHLVLCAEARGLHAETEGELLSRLSGSPAGQTAAQGLLRYVDGSEVRWLRPDAVAHDAHNTIWIEVFTSYPGQARADSMRALFHRVGSALEDGSSLSHVALFALSRRTELRLLSLLRELVKSSADRVLIEGRRHFREIEPTVFEVQAAVEVAVDSARTRLAESVVGHITVQTLPTWLPKVRIDSRNCHSTAGWFSENYLPYRRPAPCGPWPAPSSPLLLEIGGT